MDARKRAYGSCALLALPLSHMKEPPPMKLYVTYGSPYARLARMVVVEKGLEGRVAILEAKTRTAGSPYYQINPSVPVPYLLDDAGVCIEGRRLTCAYLDRPYG